MRRPYFWVTQLWGCHAGVDDPRTDIKANDSNKLFGRWPCRFRLRAGPSVCSDISSGPPTTFHWALAKGPNRFQNRKICTHTEGAKEPPGTHRKPKGVPRKGGEYAILTRPHCALPTGSTEFTLFIFFVFVHLPWSINSLNRAAQGCPGIGYLKYPCLGSRSLSSRFLFEVKVLSLPFPFLGSTYPGASAQMSPPGRALESDSCPKNASRAGADKQNGQAAQKPHPGRSLNKRKRPK